ncbi:hypothetical protein EMIHUDRAFT_631900, partial [Emiliania huxleyi CCMP1516]
ARVLLEVCEEVASGAQHSASLHEAASGGGSDGERGAPCLGAEDLLPITVYVVLRSRVAVLPSELELVAELLPSELAGGREGYALTTMQCACHVLLRTPFSQGLLEACGAEAEAGAGPAGAALGDGGRGDPALSYSVSL